MSIPANNRASAGHRVPLLLALALAFLTAGVSAADTGSGVRVERLRHSTTSERTRIVLDLDGAPTFRKSETADPPTVIIELPGVTFAPGVGPLAIGDGRVETIRVVPPDRLPAQVVLDLSGRRSAKVFLVPPGDGKPDRLVVDVFGMPSGVGGEAPGSDPAPLPGPDPAAARAEPEARPVVASSSPPATVAPVPPIPAPAAGGTATKDRHASQTPWVIVIDPGHGGHDPGAKGPGGLREKDICLALGRAIAADLNKRPGYKAVLTRDSDVFLHLRQRTRIAAEQRADLFISIHANSSRSKRARGTEVYFLSLRGASDEAASEVAMRENAADHVEGVPPESQGEIEDILVDLLRTSALERSSELAVTVVEHLRADPNLELRGVKQAGFDVLKTAGMPSILIEAAFISHAKEAKLLKSRDFQRKFASTVGTAVQGFLDRAAATDTPDAAARPAPTKAAARPPASGAAPTGS